jgi:WS/DGAT/MGAT family acyltransferase
MSGWQNTAQNAVTGKSFQLLGSLPNDRSPQQQFSTSLLSSLLQPVPSTPFNGPLSAQRQFAWAEFAYPEIRTIRSILGGTVNDVVLTIIAGGLGRYLCEHGKNTDNLELRVACPVMFRRHAPSGQESSESNEAAPPLSAMFVPLYLGLADPVLRFAAERKAMEEIRTQNQAQAFAGLQTVSRLFPPALQALSSMLAFPQTVTNTISLNIPGPQIPLYLAGHKRLALYPIGPLTANIGLFHATASYNQKLTIGVTVDPHLVPDVWHYTECLQTSFHELHAAAQRVRQQSASPQTTQHVT